MTHIPTQEADDQKVYRIAGELGISLEDAAITCAGFELAFSDDRMRRAIFEIIDQLDYEAYKNGEPLAMILSYAVELGMDGIHVSRNANEIPPRQVVSLTPTNRAMIFLKIKDNFPTQQFLGPLIVNRPDLVPEDQCAAEQSDLISDFDRLPSLDKEGWQTDVFCRADGVVRSDTEINKLPSLDKEGWQTDAFCRADGVVRSDTEINKGCPVGRGDLTASDITDSEIPTDLSSLEPAEALTCEPTRTAICLGPIRLKFNERFPFVSARTSRSPRAVASSGGYLSPVTGHLSLAASHLSPVTSHLSRSAASGLSPPYPSENLGHSERKMFLRHWQ